MAYIEMLADEQQQDTAIGFMSRGVAWFNGQGVECRQVMSDNGPAYVSRSFAKACKAQATRLVALRSWGKCLGEKSGSVFGAVAWELAGRTLGAAEKSSSA